MQALREQELRQFAPRALAVYLEALVNGWSDLERAGIHTPLRVSHFLAQVAHETGGFTILRERTNWTPEQMCKLWPARFKTRMDPRVLACRGNPEQLANLAYSGRKDLGNEERDDGWAYRGGGFMQTTGRASYRAAGTAIGADLEGEPELIENGSISLRAAIWEWGRHDLNHFADRNYARAIGNAINRGDPFYAGDPIGVESREQWLARAWALFGEGTLPNPDDLALGAYGPRVRQLQGRLRELGYGVGAIDGTFGAATARAVAAFKLDHKRANWTAMEPEEVVGKDTWEALEQAEPVKVSAARAATTPQQLADMGSTEVQAGLQQQAIGKLLLLGGGAEAGRQAGALDYLQTLSSTLAATRTALVPILEAVSWGLKNAFWAAVVLGGVWVWTKGRQGILARLAAHVQGFNLWR